MSQWTSKYGDDERAAIERAWCELRIKPWRAIAEAAARGELRPRADADPLPPFKIPESSARTIALAAERRRAGLTLPAELAKMAPQDHAETLRRRLVGLVDHELSRLEKAQAKTPNKETDAEQLRKLARAIRELGAVPDPTSKRLPREPGQRTPDGGRAPDSKTRDSLAGRALSAVDRTAPRPAPGGLPLQEGQREHAPGAADTTSHDHDHDHERDDDSEPCSPARGDAAGLVADGVVMAATARSA